METNRRHRCTQIIHEVIIQALVKVATFSVAKARFLIISVPILSLSLFAVGFFTNFTLETDQISLWTPPQSDVLKHGRWIEEESGFPARTYPIHLILHSNGDNVLTMNGVDTLFKALQIFEATEGHADACNSKHRIKANFTNHFPYSASNCSISGITNFFNEDYETYLKTVESKEDLLRTISKGPTILKSQLVNEFLGYPTFLQIPTESGGQLMVLEAQLLKLRIGLPMEKSRGPFEKRVISRLLEFRLDVQNDDSNVFHIEILSTQSYDEETVAAIEEDLYLLPIIVAIMCIFSSSVYFRRNLVQSSCLCLGIGSVVSVTLSLLTSFGIMFLFGMPFSILAAVVPFVVLGIGLDDAFIITGAFERTDPTLVTAERMKEAISDCGMSIVLTTLTTTSALLLGLMTSVPAMKAFYSYAALCVLIDFVYQITFFVALIKVDQERKESSRYDCFPCFYGPSRVASQDVQGPGVIELFLRHFCGTLERSKFLKVSICLVFCSWAIVSAIYCSKLRVSFDFTDLLPSNSYVKSFIAALETHAELEAYKCTVFFRDVDFSSPSVQSHMDGYITELAQLTQHPPENFWLYDFQKFTNQSETSIESLSFEEQMDVFLENDMFKQLYSNQIVRNTSEGGGKMVASAVVLPFTHIPVNDARYQTSFLRQQQRISIEMAETLGGAHPSRLPFFTFAEDYYMWAFYSVAGEELVLTTILTLLTVTLITLLFVPNFIACLVVTLSITMIYADVLGIAYFAGLSINPVTLVSISMSIGLLVDYILHIVLRCFEPMDPPAENTNTDSGNEDVVDGTSTSTSTSTSSPFTQYKGVRECLTTMGSSVLIGGMSTVLSTTPLMFSTSTLFKSICIVFFGFVAVSLLHGIVFVPALLMLCLPHRMDVEGDGGVDVPDGIHGNHRNVRDGEEERTDREGSMEVIYMEENEEPSSKKDSPQMDRGRNDTDETWESNRSS